MEANVDEDMQEGMAENMGQEMNEALPVKPAEHAQQVTSSDQNDTSAEQPKKRGRKQKEKEPTLTQADLDQISASVDQEMESIFQSVTTAKPLQK